MAVGSSFKQECPTCEAMVPIRDAGLVGKKIECPKCKDKFVVQGPKGANGKSAAPQKKRFRDEEDEDLDDDDGVDEIEDDIDDDPPPAKANGKAKNRQVADEDDDVEEVDDDELEQLKALGKKKGKKQDASDEKGGKGKSKKKGDAKKMHMGLVLAGVGLVALGIAAYFMIFRGAGDTTPKQFPVTGTIPVPGAKGDPGPAPKAKDKTEDGPSETARLPLTPPTPALTNLLPPDTQHVFHAYLKELYDSNLIRPALLDLPAALVSAGLKEQLGFNPLNVDDLIRAEKFKPEHWVFTVIHLKEEVSLPNLTRALGLERQERIKGREYYLAKTSNPIFDRLARASFGVPLELQQLAQIGDNRQTYVHVHDRQTLIFADKEPLVEFLTVEGRFPLISEEESAPGKTLPGMPPGTTPPVTPPITTTPPVTTTPPATTTPPGTTPPVGTPGTVVPGTTPPETTGSPVPSPPLSGRRGAYRTLRNVQLKAILDRMEAPEEEKEKVFYSSVTDLTSAVMSPPGPEYRGKVVYRPGALWDVTLLLNEVRPRLQTLGTSLREQGPRKYQLRQELTGLSEDDAKEVRKDLLELKARDVVRFVDRLLSHKVEMPAGDPATVVTPPVGTTTTTTVVPIDPAPSVPGMKKTAAAKSRLQLDLTSKVIQFNLDLVLDQAAYRKLEGVTSMFVASLGAELDAADAALNRHLLAMAVRKMAETGSIRKGATLPPGKYPPATFPRPASPTRVGMLPDDQVSWMAALLPFVGQESLYRKIHLEESWRDPVNWMAGRTIIPQFLDPSYPDAVRFVAYDEMPIELGATHYVGIAGVGLDAADFKPGDPATVHKRGVFGYGRQLALEQIKAGRGLSNVAVLIQVPHDSPIGVTPWIAGGGSTVRGIPETNSIAPFILGKDRAGKPITHDGKRGTYVLMSDGSVRFVDQNVSDDVFKAMATVEGPAPKGFDLDKNEDTPLLPPPASKLPAGKLPAAKDAPATKTPFFPFPFPKKEAVPEKKDAPMKDGPTPMSMLPAPRPNSVARAAETPAHPHWTTRTNGRDLV